MGLGSRGGTVRKTSDSVIGIAGDPSRVYSVTWLSGTTAGNLVLRNGSDATGDIFIQEEGTASQTKTLTFEEGLLFPSGCFFDKDTNVTAAVIAYSVDK